MKRIIIFTTLIASISFSSLRAQNIDTQKYGPHAQECMQYLSFYDEYYKQKDYDRAISNWRKAYQLCPTSASKNMIIRGPKLVNMLISKNAKNPQYKAALVDTLMTLYDQWIELKPDQSVSILNSKGIDINKYFTDPDKRLAEFEKIIKNNGSETKSSFFSYDLDAAIALYNEGKVAADSVIGIYTRNSELAAKYVPEGTMDSTQVAKVRKDLSSMFVTSGVASCDKLEELFKSQMDADPMNAQLVARVVKTLNSVQDCQSGDFYLSALETLNRLDPTAISSYTMFRIRASKDDVNGAIEYLKKAMEEEPSNEDYLYQMANYCYVNGRNGEAVNYAAKLTASPIYEGKAYLMMGSIWGSLSCGGDEFTAYTHFWVAYDYMAKAKAADPSLADDASRYMATFQSRFPKTVDAFMHNINDGDSYTVVCGGLRATTKVRTIK